MKSGKNRIFFLGIIVFLGGIAILTWRAFPNRHIDNTTSLRINFSRRPLTVDSRKTCDYISSALEFLLFEGLMRVTDSGALLPGLAERYEISTDQLMYTFHLRDAVWSDGEPITAYDFERTWKEILTPDFPSQSPFLLYSIVNAKEAKKGKCPLSKVGVEAVNEKTLVVQLKNPTPYFLELTSFVSLFPTPAVMGTDMDEVVSFDPPALVSNGPFVLNDYKPASHYTLVKNPKYWDHQSITLETIDISLVEDDSTAYSMFKTGKLDIVGLAFSRIPRDAIASLRASGELNIVPINATSMVQFNTQKKPFNNENLRKAIGYAIDRKALCDHVTQMDERVAEGIVASYNDGKIRGGEDHYFNIEKAKEHLRLALSELNCTIEELAPIKYLYIPSDQNVRIVASITDRLSKTLGIKVVLEGQEFQLFLNKLRKKDFEMCQTAWISQFNDPMNILDRFRTADQPTNDTGWENPQYREFLELAEKSTDHTERLNYLKAAEAIFMEEAPQTPIFYWNFAYVKQPNIENIQTSPIGVPIISRVRKAYPTEEVAS